MGSTSSTFGISLCEIYSHEHSFYFVNKITKTQFEYIVEGVL